MLRIEEAVRDIIGIKEIRGEAREGQAVVTVRMEAGSDMAKAVNLAKVRVDGIAAFPSEAEEPIIEEIEAMSRAIFVSIYGDIDAASSIKNSPFNVCCVPQRLRSLLQRLLQLAVAGAG